MSAQAGIWNFDGKPIEQTVLEKLGSALDRYGPDGGSACAYDSMAMLYRAFHTTRESRLERQPQETPCGHVFTWDGRLDNRDELMSQLNDALRADCTDLAIVEAAFDRWDTDCFHRLIGDWAVAIWKPEDRQLIFAVDYIGVRHIFYYAKWDRVWWSTDVAPLVLFSGDKFTIDADYIGGYFANDPDAQRTPYREICQAPPGHFVRIRNRGVSVERYWRFSPKSDIRYKTDAEYEEHFRCMFRQSVRRRLRSDSPILSELSGGLDSSSIVCMADDILATKEPHAPRLDTISYYDETEPDGDDWTYFRKVEEKRGRAGAHVDVSASASGPITAEYPEFAALPGYLGLGRPLEAARAAIVRERGYRAVLSGVGGDEFMGGIPDPSAQLADLIVHGQLVSLAKQLVAWSLVKRRPWIQLLSDALVDLLPASLRQYLVKEAKVETWIEPNFAKRARIAVKQLGVDEQFGLWLPTRQQYIRGLLMMGNNMSKRLPPALALEETRYPYLDQNLIEFILSIPANQLLRPGERRSLMRRSLAGIVPQEILSRRTKQFAARTPMVAIGKNSEQLREHFSSPLSSALGYVNPRLFMERLEEAQHGKKIHIVRMFRTISLELWLRQVVARGLLDEKTSASLLTIDHSLRAQT
jgi:asparagine synthase (glutamine-hydrolysing)